MSYSLTISWTAASPAPANGYRIKYWPTSSPGTITTVTPNVSGTTHTITGLADTSYTGTVEASCGGGNFSAAQNFSATVTPTYYYYALNEYACIDCALGSTAKVGRSTTVLSTTSGTHYKVGTYSYEVTNEILPAPVSFDVDLDTATQTGTTCNEACGTTPSGSFSFTNQHTTGSIAISDVQPAWFTLNTAGTLTPGQIDSGSHAGYSGTSFNITISTLTATGCVVLLVNGSPVSSYAVTATGIITMALSQTISSSDTVVLTYTNACP